MYVGKLVWWAEDAEHKRVVGFARVSPIDASTWSRHVELLGVEERARGKGVGTALLKQVLSDSVSSAVTLTDGNDADHDRLVRFYQRFGFAKCLEKTANGNTKMVKRSSF
jgi:GNAT superfamily N-acetyltransferase